MDGLQANFGDQIEFLHIDVDDVRERQIGQKLGVFRHTQYVLIDDTGATQAEWNGYLSQEEVAIALDAALADR